LLVAATALLAFAMACGEPSAPLPDGRPTTDANSLRFNERSLNETPFPGPFGLKNLTPEQINRVLGYVAIGSTNHRFELIAEETTLGLQHGSKRDVLRTVYHDAAVGNITIEVQQSSGTFPYAPLMPPGARSNRYAGWEVSSWSDAYQSYAMATPDVSNSTAAKQLFVDVDSPDQNLLQQFVASLLGSRR
jgi:hypothetical protein